MTETDDLLEQFSERGFIYLGDCVDKKICSNLYHDIKQSQYFGPEIFLDEKTFFDNPKYKNVNPKAKRNKLDDYPEYTSEVEATDKIQKILSSVLGENYVVLNKKIICGVPEQWIPQWILDHIRNNPVNNLGAYVKPEFRNITFFYGIDFHQDIIDWPDRDPDFITLYVYLHDVDDSAAPLNLLADSHRLGVDKFPHDLQTPADLNSRLWQYNNQVSERTMQTEHIDITGPVGTAALWHSYTLHGTMPNYGKQERISLRYLIAKNQDASNTFIDRVNKEINSKNFDSSMRLDIDEQGKNTVKQNYLYSQYAQKNRN